MTPYARLAWSFLLSLPLIRWMAALGAVIMALGLLGGAKGSEILGLGSLLAILAPAMLLGPAMRSVASGGSVRLRPQAHCKLLGMMYLVVLLLTLVMIVPQWLLYNFGAIPAMGEARHFLDVSASLRFAVGTWSVLSLVAIATFFLPAMPGQSLTLAVLLMAAGTFGAKWLDSLRLPYLALPFMALGAWCAFSLWFLRGPVLTAIAQRLLQPAGGKPGSDFFMRAVQSSQDTGLTGRDSAIRAYLLGSPSLKGLLVSSLFALLPMTPMLLLQAMSHRSSRLFDPPLAFIGLFAMLGVVQALTATRRARALWLRAGLNRIELFNLVERESLTASATVLAVLVVPLGALTVWRHPELLVATLCYTAASAMMGLVGMYYAMSLVQRMTILDYTLGMIGFLAWLPLVALLLPAYGSPIRSVATTAVAALIAYALRIHAHRRWEHLDWRVLRPLLRAPGSRL